MMQDEEARGAMAQSIERYDDADWLRVAVKSIPVLGEAIDTALTYRHRKFAQQRMRYLLAGLEADVARLGEQGINKQFLESEEFHDLLVSALHSAAETRHREKIRLNARILSGAIDAGHSPTSADGAEAYLDVIRDLSFTDLVVLRAIIAQQRFPPSVDDDNALIWATSRGWDRLESELASVGGNDLEYRLHRLERAGCIKEITGSYLDYTGGTYTLTGVARQLAEWVDRCGGFPSDSDVRTAEERASAV